MNWNARLHKTCTNRHHVGCFQTKMCNLQVPKDMTEHDNDMKRAGGGLSVH